MDKRTPDSYKIDEITSRMRFGNLTPSMRMIDAKNVPFLTIFACVLLLLVIWKPRFVLVYKNPQRPPCISYQKLFSYWLLISCLISGGYYAYKMRKQDD